MRIAIEVFGTQSESRFRGVGRYTHELVNALLDLDTGHEFLLYAEEGAPSDYDEYLDSGSVAGLTAADDLFPELA